MAYLSERATIGAVVESSYGDGSAVSASDLFLAKNIAVVPHSDKIDRDLQKVSLSTMKHRVTRLWQEVNFTTEIKGDGSKLDALFKGLGFNQVGGAYLPVSVGFKSISIYVYMGGKLYKIPGAVGARAEIVLEAGEIGMINWTFHGLYRRPVDQSIVSGSNYDATIPPLVTNAGAKIGGYAGIIQAVNISIENTVTRRTNVNAEFGIEGFQITGRAITGSINPESVQESVHPFWQNWETGVSESLEITIGQVSGNKWVISAPNVVKDSITPGDRDGVRIYDIPISFHMQNGDDELRISPVTGES